MFKMFKFMHKSIAAAQNELLEKHYEEVSSIYRDMRGWRHDYHNHLQTIKGHIALNQIDELNAYLDSIEQALRNVDTLLKTGNTTADAILNSKLTLAKQKNITITAKATVPNDLRVSEIDLCIIIGNLLDNAIESCEELADRQRRFIRIYIDIIKKQFYISVVNSVGAEPKKIGYDYITAKSKYHGFGIKRINSAVHKYGGYVNRKNEIGVFATEIMIPLTVNA